MSSDNNDMGIWAAPVYQDGNSNAPTPNMSQGQGLITDPKDRRIKWGIKDVVWGFLLMIAFQVFMSIAAVIGIAVNMVRQNMSVDDPDALIDTILNEVLSGPFIFITSVSMYFSWWIVTRRATKKKGMNSYAKDFWLKINWKRDILIGLFLATVLRLGEWGLLWFLENVANVDLTEAGNTEIFMAQPGFWFIVNAILIAGIIGPFFEEFFFRGLFLQASMRLLGRSRTRKPSRKGAATWLYKNRVWISVMITSIVFGFLHFQGDLSSVGHWIVVVQTGVIGVILAIVTLKTKRLGPAITTHIMFNLSGIILAFLLNGG